MSLSPENIKLIQAKVNEAGDALKDHLPPIDNFVNRNSYAHCWSKLRSHLGKSYKDCNDEDVVNILETIEYYKNNPE